MRGGRAAVLGLVTAGLAGLGAWRALAPAPGPLPAAGPVAPEAVAATFGCDLPVAVAWPGDGERLGCLTALDELLAVAAEEAGCTPGPLPDLAPGDRLRLRPGGEGGCEVRRERLPGGSLRALGLPLLLNEAEVDDLVALPGIGPKKARAIVEDRAARGPFGSLEALARVKGIGPATVRRLAPYLTAAVERAPAEAWKVRGGEMDRNVAPSGVDPARPALETEVTP